MLHRIWQHSPKSSQAGERRPRPALEVLEARTVPSFLPVEHYAVGEAARAVVAADFNADGAPDLAVTRDQSVAVLLGQGDGSFPKATFWGDFTPAPPLPLKLAAADFNLDGHLDLAVGHYQEGGAVSLLLGQGDGSFEQAVDLKGLFSPAQVHVGDFNADNVPDLAVLSGAGSRTHILLGNGDATFTEASVVPAGRVGVQDLVLADLDGDGKLDFAVTMFESGGRVFLGQGDGTFRPEAFLPLGGIGALGLAAADLDGDAIPDLAVGRQLSPGGVRVLRGRGDGTFLSWGDYPTGITARFVAAADFTGDGVPDLVVSNQHSRTVSVLRGHGDGSFQAALNFEGFGEPWGVAVEDYNGDGLPDLAVTDRVFQSVGVLLNDGDWGAAPGGGAGAPGQIADLLKSDLGDTPWPQFLLTPVQPGPALSPPEGETVRPAAHTDTPLQANGPRRGAATAVMFPEWFLALKEDS